MMDNSNGSGLTGVDAQQQQSSSSLDSSSAGAQEAALHLLQSLLQVTVFQSFLDPLQNPYTSLHPCVGLDGLQYKAFLGTAQHEVYSHCASLLHPP